MKNRILSLTAAMALSLSSPAATVETDRTWYVAGEAMTVRVTAAGAAIAYAELCDTQGLAAATIIALRGNEGTGILELPPHLHSGYYLLSAYTRHDVRVSQRLVAIVNPLHKSAADDIEWVPDDSCRVTVDSTWVTVVRHQSPTTPEQEGHVVMARIRNVRDGQTFKAAQIRPTLSIVGKQIHYFEGQMASDTLALFYTYGIHGRLPIVLTAVTTTGMSLPVEIVSPYAALLPKQLPHLVFHYQRSQVEARSLDMQRRQASMANPHPPIINVYDDTAYGTKPYLSYNLDEYRQFLTVREVLLEYVRCVSNKRADGVPHLTVYGELTPEDSTRPTLVLIDGMPVGDTEQLLSYDARRVHYINIYAGQYTFGNGVYNGILSFVTRSGQLTNFPTAPNTQYLVYDFPE